MSMTIKIVIAAVKRIPRRADNISDRVGWIQHNPGANSEYIRLDRLFSGPMHCTSQSPYGLVSMPCADWNLTN